VSGSYDNTVRLWDAKTGAAVGEPLSGHTSWVNSVAFSPDGQHIMSGSDDNTIRVWEASLRTGFSVTNDNRISLCHNFLLGQEFYSMFCCHSGDESIIIIEGA